jgi:hypothetical protein
MHCFNPWHNFDYIKPALLEQGSGVTSKRGWLLEVGCFNLRLAALSSYPKRAIFLWNIEM